MNRNSGVRFKRSIVGLVISLCLLGNLQGVAQHTIGNRYQCALCDSAGLNPQHLIGRTFKILHYGGVRPGFNESKTYPWPSEEMRKKSGESGWEDFKPATGDTGRLVDVYYEDGMPVYILSIKGYYVAISCSYLGRGYQFDTNESSLIYHIADSIQNLAYADGCKFKLLQVNGNWAEAGHLNIDKIAETFACDLVSKGIDTVMLCKYIGGNSPTSRSFITWETSGNFYLKCFYRDFETDTLKETAIKPFDAAELFNYFFAEKIYELTTDPDYKFVMSHCSGYTIQVYTPDIFYRQSFSDCDIYQGQEHPKAVWWRMVGAKLETIEECGVKQLFRRISKK